MRNNRAIVLAAIAALAFSACSSDDTSDAGEATAAIEFASPTDGATVSNPVAWSATATGFTIEAAGEVVDGAGHLHIMVDTDCVAAGETIVADDAHQHFGDGSTSGELKADLAPGEHTLCLQAADGEHVALDITHEITITVE